MSGLYRLFEASPEAAFGELEEGLARMEAQMAAVSEGVEAVRQVFEKALQRLTMPPVAAPAPTRWTYEAPLPNLYFDNVFEPEVADGTAKRWVRRSGLLKARLALPREVQYDFSVAVANFAVPEARASFRLAVDGRDYPWLSVDDNVFSTVILEAPAAEGLEFVLSVDADLLPRDRDISFSFSRIDIVRRGPIEAPEESGSAAGTRA